jgi:hypothetical protein
MDLPPRLILFHKQKSSARARFMCFADTVLAFGPLPASAALRPEASDRVRLHPAAHLRVAEERLGLPGGSLESIPEFQFEAETSDGTVPVLLAGFTSIDPPFAAAERVGARFAPITEARGLPTVELELLRRAYEVLIG